MFNGSFKSLICWGLIPKTDLLAPWGPLWIMSFALSVGWSTSSYTVIITHLDEREKEREVWSRYICQVRHNAAFLYAPSLWCKWADGGRMHEMSCVLATQADINRGWEYCLHLHLHMIYFYEWPISDIWIQSSLIVAHMPQGSFSCKPLRETAVNEINQ